MRSSYRLVALAVGLCLIAGYAMAQAVVTTPPAGSVDIGPLLTLFLQYVVPIVGSLIGVLTLWLQLQVQKRTGLQIDDSMRDALQTALTNAAGLVFNQLQTAANVGKIVNVGSPLIAEAITYVQNSAAGALAHFGLTPAAVAQKIVAKLGVLTATATPTATPAAAVALKAS